MKCANCGCENTEISKYCINCGFSLPYVDYINAINAEKTLSDKQRPLKRIIKKIGTIFSLVIIFVGIYFMFVQVEMSSLEKYMLKGEFNNALEMINRLDKFNLIVLAGNKEKVMAIKCYSQFCLEIEDTFSRFQSGENIEDVTDPDKLYDLYLDLKEQEKYIPEKIFQTYLNLGYIFELYEDIKWAKESVYAINDTVIKDIMRELTAVALEERAFTISDEKEFIEEKKKILNTFCDTWDNKKENKSETLKEAYPVDDCLQLYFESGKEYINLMEEWINNSEVYLIEKFQDYSNTNSYYSSGENLEDKFNLEMAEYFFNNSIDLHFTFTWQWEECLLECTDQSLLENLVYNLDRMILYPNTYHEESQTINYWERYRTLDYLGKGKTKIKGKIELKNDDYVLIFDNETTVEIHDAEGNVYERSGYTEMRIISEDYELADYVGKRISCSAEVNESIEGATDVYMIATNIVLED